MTRSNTGNSFTKLVCTKREQPIKYTGTQTKSTDRPVYQFVVTGEDKAVADANLCGGFAVGYNSTTSWDWEAAGVMKQGQAFRVSRPSYDDGNTVLFYGDCNTMNRDQLADHMVSVYMCKLTIV